MADAKRSSSGFPAGQPQSSSQFKDWECGERYLLERILGKGSYGQVAQAIDRTTDRKVAVKQMKNIFDDQTDAKRAYREMHILRNLKHTNIIALVDVISPTIQRKIWQSGLVKTGCAAASGDELDLESVWRALATPTGPHPASGVASGGIQHQSPPKHPTSTWASDGAATVYQRTSSNYDHEQHHTRVGSGQHSLGALHLGHLYLVFDFMDTDLSKIIRSNQFMTTGHVQFILYQILLGLKYMHSANVIHRDLKPANILVSCTDCTIRIADFGLSRVVEPEIISAPKVAPAPAPAPVQPVQQQIPAGAGAHRKGYYTGNDIDIDSEWQMEEFPVDAEGNIVGGSITAAQAASSHDAPMISSPLPNYNWIFNDQNSQEKHRSQSINHLDMMTSCPGFGQPLERSNALTGSEPLTTLSTGTSSSSSSAPTAHPGRPTMSRVPLKRTLTKHVITRWYRAPEVILCQPYNAAVDVWSAGCIFAELLSMMSENVRSFDKRRPLFPGESCGELSAGTDDEEDETSYYTKRRSQLNVIFSVLGTPREGDITHLDPKSARDIRNLKPVPQSDLRERYPGTDDAGLDLLKAMLKFDPSQRITVDAALAHPYLASVRNLAKEQAAARPMSAEIETIGEDPEHIHANIVKEVMTYQKMYDADSKESDTRRDAYMASKSTDMDTT